MMYTNPYVQRGAILEVTSGPHKGDKYTLVRTASGNDRNFLGTNLPTVRYSFNLLNLATGKMRQTEADRQYVTTADGINSKVYLPLLEQHFGMTFKVVTDMPTVAPAVDKAVEAVKPKPLCCQLQACPGLSIRDGALVLPLSLFGAMPKTDSFGYQPLRFAV